MLNTIRELSDIINASNTLVLVFVMENCENNVLHENIKKHVIEHPGQIGLYTMCYNDNNMPFPRVLPDALYYFAPQNQTPLFWRPSNHVISDIHGDIDAAFKMMQGATYAEARFSGNDRVNYENSEKYVQEDVSTFPSAFQQARNLVKDIWRAGKNAAQGLPVIAPAEEGFKRLQICEGCDKFDKDTQRCKECGCFMKTKTQLAGASCPLNKWESIV